MARGAALYLVCRLEIHGGACEALPRMGYTDELGTAVLVYKKIYFSSAVLAPKIWESFDLSEYDVVISSSGWFMCRGWPWLASKEIRTLLRST